MPSECEGGCIAVCWVEWLLALCRAGIEICQQSFGRLNHSFHGIRNPACLLFAKSMLPRNGNRILVADLYSLTSETPGPPIKPFFMVTFSVIHSIFAPAGQQTDETALHFVPLPSRPEFLAEHHHFQTPSSLGWEFPPILARGSPMLHAFHPPCSSPALGPGSKEAGGRVSVIQEFPAPQIPAIARRHGGSLYR